MGTGASCASELDVIEEDGAASTGGEASGSLEITVKLDAALSTSGSLGNGAATTASSPITNYEVLRKIGRGSYGTVFLVRDQRDGLYYCAKQVMLELGSEEERRAAELEEDLEEAYQQIERLRVRNAALLDRERKRRGVG